MNIDCPYCNKNLEVADEYIESELTCPICSEKFSLEFEEDLAPAVTKPINVPKKRKPIQVPKKTKPINGSEEKQTINSSSKEDKMITCPFCKESVKSSAIKCKHCQTFFNSKNKNMYDDNPSETLGVLSLIFPLISSFIVISALLGVPVILLSSSFFYGILGFTVVLTGIFISIESANTFRFSEGKSAIENPVLWFIAIILIWIIAYPAWMYRRSKYKLSNMFTTSILVVVILVISVGTSAAIIENKKAEIKHNIQNMFE